jgi:hypothetical protein
MKQIGAASSAVVVLLAGAVMAVIACGDDAGPRASGDAGAAAPAIACGAAPCTRRVDGAAAFRAIAAPLPGEPGARGTVFFASTRDPSEPVLFVDAARAAPAPLPLPELRARFAGAHLPAGGPDGCCRGAGRSAYTGAIVERAFDDLGTVYLYDLLDDAGLSCAEHQALHARLAAAFEPRPLYRARLQAGDPWNVPLTCELPTLLVQTSDIEYEAYTVGTAFGTVRAYRTGELVPAAREAEFGWQDVLVLEQTPFDVETIIAGAITGTRQGQLSHLNIRSAARGTPNCYVRDAYRKLSGWAGKLVKVTCGPNAFEIAEAGLAEAEAWRRGFRPAPQTIPPPDEAVTALVPLAAVPTATAEERAWAMRRYGAKATNLAILTQRAPAALTLEGFAIPVAHYRRFLRAGAAPGAGSSTTIEAFVAQALADPAFRGDPKVRRERLGQIRAAIAAAPCPRELLLAIRDAAAATRRGAAGVWRFRSSSNAEDLLTFNGAGLYASAAGCVLDDLDDDDAGPSRCSPTRRAERPACDALRAAWASVWEPRAYDERDWAGISHEAAVMGVLVNEQSEDERANMVVFSGDPTVRGDRRLLVDAQVGTLEVVAPEEGTWPETVRLALGPDGAVTGVERLRRSSASAPGEVVLDDATLRALGAAYAGIVQQMPIDHTPPPGREVIFDSEWKVLADGRLVIKQIRPFLR